MKLAALECLKCHHRIVMALRVSGCCPLGYLFLVLKQFYLMCMYIVTVISEGIPQLSTELREMPEKILSSLGLAMHQVS